MKIKILSQLFLLASLSTIYITMSSDKNGKINSTSGCGTCHGAKNTNTTIGLSGIPAAGYVLGQTYTLTLTVSNSSMPKAGFNLATNIGSFSAPGTNCKVSSGQMTHSTPTAAVSGITSWTFNWTAPSTGSTAAVFNVAGNAVNGNNSDDSGDQWNTNSFTFSANPSTAIVNKNIQTISSYPNPATTTVNITGIKSLNKVQVCTVNGSNVNVDYKYINNGIQIDCSHLAIGEYSIAIESEGKLYTSKFIKQ